MMAASTRLTETIQTNECCDTTACCAPGPMLGMAVESAENLARMFKAISSPVRVQMLDILSRHGGEVCVCDIESQFDLSQPTISHHLGVLRKAGLIESEQRGLWGFYHVRPLALVQVKGWLAGLATDANVG